ncbi:MAG: glucose 1-dehydrogenase [Chloroflexi bacterium]|nr:MAG: short-chain dehydrogenase [Phototrophicales bacterium]RMF78858.1 MAG: glucose 1-dehydrogenase [Chloroflexota bacterium]
MNNVFDITGKVAIITGASRGIGFAIATHFAEAGAKVTLSSRKQDGLDAAAAEIRASHETADVLPVAAHNGDKIALQALVQKTVETYGRIDILVNNAATNPHFGTLLDAEDSLWHKTIEVNVMGNVWLTQAVVPIMIQHGGGKIINIASVNGIRPGSMQGIYSMTKAAIISLTQTLAMELASDNIQVNAIAPGLIQTKFARAIWDNEALLSRVMNRTPAGRIGQPDDMVGIAHFLASAASDYATGQVYVVDGGLTVPMI